MCCTSSSMSEPGGEPLGIYLHIPWCPSRCIYCDFNTYVDAAPALVAAYQRALLREIRLTGAALGRPAVQTLYIGGGTPTSLPPPQLGALVDAVVEAFDLESTAEITCEANPGTVTEDDLRALRTTGINRLSFGVQSLDDALLRRLGRRHDAATARQAIAAARQAGFDNLNLDLIFALPDQSLRDWARTLDEVCALDPAHLSLYALMIEPATPLARMIRQGALPHPDDDLAAEMYHHAVARLDRAGYVQYELSNWAGGGEGAAWQNPPLAAAHNLIYWRRTPYLGLGAGAHGFRDGVRAANLRRPVDYVRAIERGTTAGAATDPRTLEVVRGPQAQFESVMLALRLTREGLSERQFLQHHGLSLHDVFAAPIAAGIAAGTLEWQPTPRGAHLRLTPPGRFVANQILLDFAP